MAIQPSSSAAAPIGVSVKASDASWKLDVSQASHDGAVRKPAVYGNTVLASTNHINNYWNEMRMDFTLRVAHGEVDPASGSGLRLAFNDSPRAGVAAKLRTMAFESSYTTGSDADGNVVTTGEGANKWAQHVDDSDGNEDEYSIRQDLHSGAYDYLTVSVTVALDYPQWNEDNDPYGANAWWADDSVDADADDAGKDKRFEGKTIDPMVYAMVGPQADSGRFPDSTLVPDDLDKSSFAFDVTKQSRVTTYPGSCQQKENYDPNSEPPEAVMNGCDVPDVLTGWEGLPNLWSGGLSNWSLMTDNSLSEPNGSNAPDESNGKTYGPGIAPPDSFFVQWLDPAKRLSRDNPCYSYTSFKYQWVGLEDGDRWVPVNDLTPTAVEASQTDSYADYESGQYDADDMVFNGLRGTGSEGGTDGGADASNQLQHSLIAPGAKAQEQPGDTDPGAIDFAKAKRDQPGLDGYFKLVTWPVTDAQCIAKNPDYYDSLPTRDGRNPANQGVTDTMSATAASRQIASGWTVGSALYQFDIARPDAPVITSVADGGVKGAAKTGFTALKAGDADFVLGDGKASVSISQSVISGTGKAGDTVTLFADEPGSAAGATIRKTDRENTDGDVRGRTVGTAVVGTNGTWSITDTEALDPLSATQRRYHAYQTQPKGTRADGQQLTSHFSPIEVVDFSKQADPAPLISNIDFPHTKNGAVPGYISISGTANPWASGSKLTVYALPADGPNAVNPAKLPANTSKSAGLKYQTTLSQAGAQTWAYGGKTDSVKFNSKAVHDYEANAKVGTVNLLFVASLVTPDGLVSPTTVFKQRVNMASPGTTIDPVAASAKEVHGTASYDAAGKKAGLTGGGLTVHLTWPKGTTGGVSSVVSGADGKWSVPMPTHAVSGTLKAQVTDAETNQGKPVTTTLKLVPPVSQLPLTGGGAWCMLAGIGAVVALAVALATALTVVLHRRNRLRSVAPTELHFPDVK